MPLKYSCSSLLAPSVPSLHDTHRNTHGNCCVQSRAGASSVSDSKLQVELLDRTGWRKHQRFLSLTILHIIWLKDLQRFRTPPVTLVISHASSPRIDCKSLPSKDYVLSCLDPILTAQPIVAPRKTYPSPWSIMNPPSNDGWRQPPGPVAPPPMNEPSGQVQQRLLNGFG